jgi:ATP-dependent exoDNAse (exonuclease V) alpha subunit
MYLNNKLIDHGICNGTIGVITKTINADNVEVTFPTNGNIIKLNVQKISSNFDINGSRASRYQFPLQNAFALTVHKTQGITLPHATVNIDENMFAPGQAYVAMSRAPSWNQLDIHSFDNNSIKIDKDVIAEYRRLNLISQNGLKSLTNKIKKKKINLNLLVSRSTSSLSFRNPQTCLQRKQIIWSRASKLIKNCTTHVNPGSQS